MKKRDEYAQNRQLRLDRKGLSQVRLIVKPLAIRYPYAFEGSYSDYLKRDLIRQELLPVFSSSGFKTSKKRAADKKGGLRELFKTK